ncbi:sensor histidine kinase [Actinomadura sp. 3N508]|uniref:sensor histidine kinase n=1 Tax=Actinomadura sp. 3N508 TaxID=3375153 RepID=UPI00378996F5
MRTDRLLALMNRARRHRAPGANDALIAIAALLSGCVLLGVDAFYLYSATAGAVWLVPPLVLACGSLALRRARPLLGLVLAAVAVAADLLVGPSFLPVLVLADLLYNATLYGSARVVPWLVVGGCAVSGLATLVVLASMRSDRGALPAAACTFLLSAWPFAMGLTVRRHREQAERAEQARRRSAVECRESVLRERARVTGDIHDIVCNHLSAIALLSTAATATAPRDDEKHLTVLAAIRQSSLDGVAEARRLIATLRTGATAPEPGPGVLDLARSLVDRMANLGSPARLRTVGTPVELHGEIEAAACRIVQESLTNALKHAGGAAVETVLAYLPDRVVITVANDLSRTNPDLALGGSGVGLFSMAERAARVGGTCTARRDTAGWTVHAVLPLSPSGRVRPEPSLSGGS